MMTNLELVDRLKAVAGGYKTLYVMGCFGAPMTEANKQRYIQHHPYNQRPGPMAAIKAASADTFGFDCVCLIKGILWGWKGNKNHVYGGAVYASNGVPDIDTESIIKVCKDVKSTWSIQDMVPGELLWKSGHVGIYIGDGKAVECTPSWANKVQISHVQNLGDNTYPARTWTKHGKLPYITYEAELPFVDVPGDAWYRDDLVTCYRAGLLKGTDDTHYSPAASVTRAQMASILARILRRISK